MTSVASRSVWYPELWLDEVENSSQNAYFPEVILTHARP